MIEEKTGPQNTTFFIRKDLAMNIGDRIKLVRGEMSREKFAPLTGVSKNTLVFYEKNEREPGADYLRKILELFPSTNPTWLLTGEGEMEDNWKPLSSVDEEYKNAYQKLLLIVLEAVEEAQKMGWYDLSLMAPRERSALIYTLYVLFSENQLKHLASKEFIAGQSGFVYLLIRDHAAFTKNQANMKVRLDMLGLSDELNLFGRSVEILGSIMADGDDASTPTT